MMARLTCFLFGHAWGPWLVHYTDLDYRTCYVCSREGYRDIC
jgi:hypothetical protein